MRNVRVYGIAGVDGGASISTFQPRNDHAVGGVAPWVSKIVRVPGTPPPSVVSIGSPAVAPSGGRPSRSVVRLPLEAVTTSPGVSSRSTSCRAALDGDEVAAAGREEARLPGAAVGDRVNEA